MREILPGRLWIGNAGDGRDPEHLLDAGIAAVVNLAAEEHVPALPRDMVVCHFSLTDGAPNDPRILNAAIHAVASLVKNDIPTLVCCGAGMSRSPAIAAAAMSLAAGGSPNERLQQIVAGHPHDVSPQLWIAVCEAFGGLARRGERR